MLRKKNDPRGKGCSQGNCIGIKRKSWERDGRASPGGVQGSVSWQRREGGERSERFWQSFIRGPEEAVVARKRNSVGETKKKNAGVIYSDSPARGGVLPLEGRGKRKLRAWRRASPC